MYQGTYIHRSYELAAAMKRRGEAGGSLQGLRPFIGRDFQMYLHGTLYIWSSSIIWSCLSVVLVVFCRDLVPFTVELGLLPANAIPRLVASRPGISNAM